MAEPRVQLYNLAKGSLVADTPGFNRPELDITPIQLASLYPEIRSQLMNKKCKFRNCLHCEEPGCSINKDWDRYKLYREMLEEMIM